MIIELKIELQTFEGSKLTSPEQARERVLQALHAEGIARDAFVWVRVGPWSHAGPPKDTMPVEGDNPALKALRRAWRDE